MAAHLANLTFIMDFHDRLDTTKNPFVVAEFQAMHEEFVQQLEKDDEARKRDNDSQRDKAGADLAGSEPRLRSAAWESRRDGQSGGTDVRGPGAQGPNGQ